MNIRDTEISIVIQGPVIYHGTGHIVGGNITKIIIDRTRKLFPSAEIILSNCTKTNTKELDCDKYVQNVDPGVGTFYYQHYDLPNNCNRAIVSSLTGIKKASRKYVLKIRSDLFIFSKNFLKFFYKYPHFDEQYKFVRNRIIAFSIYSVKSEKMLNHTLECPYHISDWAYFGYREDLLNLFEIPLAKEPEFSSWYQNKANPYLDIFPYRSWQMSPEQHIISCFFKKFTAINFAHGYDNSHDNALLSAKLIANNFLVLDQRQFSLISLKHFYLQILFEPIIAKSAIFFRSWLRDYYLYSNVPSDLQKYTDKAKIIYQQIVYNSCNILFRFLNKKYQFIVLIVAFYIKTLI